MRGCFYGIGVGPGDPELLTLKAVNALKKSDVLAVPESKAENGSIAYGIAGCYIRPETEILRLTFPMIDDTAEKTRQRQQNAEQIRVHLEQGKTVSFITIGDPLLYSTYIYLLEHLKQANIRVITIPGITAFQAIAAGLNLPLAKGSDSVGIFCLLDTLSDYAGLFRFDTLIFMKVAAYFSQLNALFAEHKTGYDFFLVMHGNMPEEKIITDWETAAGITIPYLSTVILRRKNHAT